MGKSIGRTDAWLALGLAFVGGYGDAAGFVLARTFTGHVTGNLVLGAISVAAHEWRATLGHLLAILVFLAGTVLSMLIERPLKAWPKLAPLSAVMGIEVVLIVAASLTLAFHAAPRVEIFVACLSLALGLQNGAFRRAGGISVHTTYLTGMITTLLAKQAEKKASILQTVTAPDPGIGFPYEIWIAFVLGAGTGAAMVFHFKGPGMLGAALLLIALILLNSKGSHMEKQPLRTP